MTDLRALLGERYDVVMQAACGCDGTRTPHCYECSDSTWDHECPDPVPCSGWCAGAGKVHVGCAHLSYAELCAERDRLAATVERVRALATEWATQPNDYDEDTEQQIEDGGAILRALDDGSDR